MDAEQNGGVAPTTATESRSGKPSQDRQPENADGMNDAVRRLLTAKGITPAEEQGSADPEPEAEAGETDLSQSQDESGPLAADPSADAEVEDDPEEAEAESEETVDDDEDAPKGVQKRINKLTARAKAAEEQVEELRRQMDELKAAQQPQSKTVPDGDPEIHAISQKLGQIREDLAAAEQLRAQIATDADGVAEVLKRFAKLPNYDPQTMRDWLNDQLNVARATAARMEGALDERRKVIEAQSTAKRTEVGKLVETEMPWTKDRKDPRHAHFQRIMSTPALQALPEAAFFAAAGIEKLTAMKQRTAASAAKPKPATKPTVRPTAQGAGAPARTVAKDPLQAAREQMASGGRDGAKAYARAAVAAARNS